VENLDTLLCLLVHAISIAYAKIPPSWQSMTGEVEPSVREDDRGDVGGRLHIRHRGMEVAFQQLFVFCQVVVGQYGMSCRPFERRFLGRLSVGLSCLVVPLVVIA
jgi:hypothetical protein